MKAFRTRLSILGLVFFVAFLLSCGGDAQGEIETGTDFSMAVGASQFRVAPGTSILTPVDVTWVGCPPRDVTFEMQGLPTGVTSSLSPNPNPTATKLQLNVGSSAPAGSYDLLLRGSNSTLVHTKALRLVVDAAAPGFSATLTPATLAMDSGHPGIVSIQITRTGGFTDPISVNAILPPGFTSSLSSLTQARPPALGPAVDETRTLSLQSGSASPGPYTVSVQLTAGGLMVQKDLPVTVYALPVITGFTATPSQILPGGTSTLVPTFTGGTGAITPSGGAVLSGQNVIVTPAATTVYTLGVTNPAGTTVSQPVTVTVQDVRVQVLPSSRFVTAGKTVSLSATITGAANPALTWSIVEPGGGSLAPSGASAVYTAPASPGTYHVRATSVEDPTKYGEFTATVVPAPTITSFSAIPSLIDRGASSTLSAVFSNGTGAVDGGVGSVSSGLGVTASPLTTTTYTLTVTNLAGDSLTKTATVNVNTVSISITPTSVALSVGGTRLFTATVTGAVDTSVTWSVTEPGGGSISPAGLYTTPALDGTYHVVVTSNSDPTKSATATIFVSPISVSITPVSVALSFGGTQLFTAAVAGAVDTSVTWSVLEPGGGSITSGGLYTAPSASGTYHVMAASNADPTKSATATITIGAVTVTLTKPNPRNMTGWVADYFGVPSASGIYTITGAVDTSATLSTDEPGGSFGVDDSGFYYDSSYTPGTYHLRITSNADPSAFAEYTLNVFKKPVISLFSLTQPGGAGTPWQLEPTFVNDLTAGSTAIITDDLGAFVGNATSGVPFVVGSTHKDFYTLTVTNSIGYAVSDTASVIGISISPPSATVPVGGTASFTATVASASAPNNGVYWSLVESNAGTIDSSGNYTAGRVAGTFHIRTTSASDPHRYVDTPVTVTSVITLFPSTQRATDGSQVFMRHTLVGIPDYRVTWSIVPPTAGNNATINATTGVITVPLSPQLGVYTVIATSTADSSIAGSTTLTVQSLKSYLGFGATGAMGTPRWEHSMASLSDGRVLITGGTTTQGGTPDISQAELYDPSAGTFSSPPTASLFLQRRQHTSTLLPTGKVLIVGGKNIFGAPFDYIGMCELFDPATGSFTVTAYLTTPRAGHTAELLPNGMVLVTGGYTTGGVPVSSTELFDPYQGIWLPGPPMQRTRVRHALVRLLDGTLLAAGGSTDGTDGGLTNTAEVFAPSLTNVSTGAWTPTGTMADSLGDTAAVLTPDGNVIFAGGTRLVGASGQITNRTEIFSPTGPTFALNTFNLGVARKDAIGLLDAAGEVFFNGGFDGTSTLNTWERYKPGAGFIGTGAMRARQNGQNGRGLTLNTGSLLLTGFDTSVGPGPNHAELNIFGP